MWRLDCITTKTEHQLLQHASNTASECNSVFYRLKNALHTLLFIICNNRTDVQLKLSLRFFLFIFQQHKSSKEKGTTYVCWCARLKGYTPVRGTMKKGYKNDPHTVDHVCQKKKRFKELSLSSFLVSAFLTTASHSPAHIPRGLLCKMSHPARISSTPASYHRYYVLFAVSGYLGLTR